MSESKPFYKQYGQTLKLSGVSDEPITFTSSDKKVREEKKVQAQELIEQYEQTKAKAKREKIVKNLKALFENTEARMAKEKEEEAKATEAEKKAKSVKKSKAKTESVAVSTGAALEELEKAEKLSVKDKSKLQKLYEKFFGNKSETVVKQKSGRGREY